MFLQQIGQAHFAHSRTIAYAIFLCAVIVSLRSVILHFRKQKVSYNTKKQTFGGEKSAFHKSTQ